MSSLEKDLYKTVKVQTAQTQKPLVPSKAYRGISTVNEENNSFVLYDIGLIKQDLLNHFHIRQGEKLENPEFGCIIWDALFEPLTEALKEAIAQNVTTIVNSDPRVQADQVFVNSYESGLQIECVLTYLPYNISEQLKLQFDENNGLI
jgi:phage baseplate assembly protein W